MNIKDEVIQKFGLALALASLDDNISVNKTLLSEEENDSVYTIKSKGKNGFQFAINPEVLNGDEINDMLAHILSLESNDILGKKTKPHKLLSYNAQLETSSNIINTIKDNLISAYERYITKSTTERLKCKERDILNNYLEKLENVGNTFYFGNRVDYNTNEYKITEVMYSILSLVSGEELCLDMDKLSERVYPDLITAESYQAIKKSEQDLVDYIKLNSKSKSHTPKMALGDLHPSLVEELFLISKYKKLGLLNGAIFKTTDGYEFPLDKDTEQYQETTFSQIEFDSDSNFNNFDDDIDDSEIVDQSYSEDSDEPNIEGDEGEIYGIMYSNKNAGEGEISQIAISTLGLNMIEKCINQEDNITYDDFLNYLRREQEFDDRNSKPDSNDDKNKNDKSKPKPKDDFDDGKDL